MPAWAAVQHTAVQALMPVMPSHAALHAGVTCDSTGTSISMIDLSFRQLTGALFRFFATSSAQACAQRLTTPGTKITEDMLRFMKVICDRS